MRVITVEPRGLSNDHEDKARLLINFGEHGRELISPEIGLLFLHALCDPEVLEDVLIGFPDVNPRRLRQILKRTVLQIIPVENANGRDLVESGQLCERKNGRGVDPNRNWSVHWGYKEPDFDPKEEHPGTMPFSEPETSLLRNIANAFNPHLWLNVHSGMEAMFIPYDHKHEIPRGPYANATLSILKELNKAFCGGRCAVGPGGTTVGYLAHGTATDYMQEVLNVSVVTTWEVYGDMKASFDDCFRMFNPLTREVFTDVVTRWTAGILGLIAALPGHPGVPELQGFKAYSESSSKQKSNVRSMPLPTSDVDVVGDSNEETRSSADEAAAKMHETPALIRDGSQDSKSSVGDRLEIQDHMWSVRADGVDEPGSLSSSDAAVDDGHLWWDIIERDASFDLEEQNTDADDGVRGGDVRDINDGSSLDGTSDWELRNWMPGYRSLEFELHDSISPIMLLLGSTVILLLSLGLVVLLHTTGLYHATSPLLRIRGRRRPAIVSVPV